MDNNNTTNSTELVSLIDNVSFARDKYTSKTIGIPSDSKTKEAFDALPGADNHQRLVNLMKRFSEAVSKEQKLTFESNVVLINKSLATVSAQVEAISKGLVSEEARMRSLYIDDIKAEFDEFAKDWDKVVELTEVNQKLNDDNVKLSDKIDSLKSDIVNLNNEIEDLNDSRNELIKDNNTLLKEQKRYDDNVRALKELHEKDIKDLNLKLSESNDNLLSTSAQLEQIKSENLKLDSKINQLNKDHHTELEDLRNRLQDERVNSIEKDSKISGLISELDVVSSALKEYREENLRLEDDVKTLKDENGSCENKIEKLEKSIEDLELKEVDAKKLIKSKDSEIHYLNKRNKLLADDVEKITLDLKALTLEAESRKKENDMLSAKVKNQDAVIHEIKNKFDEKEKENFKLNLEIANLKKELEKYLKTDNE